MLNFLPARLAGGVSVFLSILEPKQVQGDDTLMNLQ